VKGRGKQAGGKKKGGKAFLRAPKEGQEKGGAKNGVLIVHPYHQGKGKRGKKEGGGKG